MSVTPTYTLPVPGGTETFNPPTVTAKDALLVLNRTKEVSARLDPVIEMTLLDGALVGLIPVMEGFV